MLNHYTCRPYKKSREKKKQDSFNLSLQSGHNLLAGLHHSIHLSRDHDGETLIFCQRQLQVGSSFLHDVNTDLCLVSFPKLVDVLVFTLLKWHMENLNQEKKSK